MKKAFRIVLTSFSVIFSLLLVMGVATSFFRSSVKLNNQQDYSISETNEELVHEEVNSLIFYSFEEYYAYLNGNQQGTSSVRTITSQPIIPTDVTLSSIIVNEEGTIMNYDLSRRQPVINFNSDDRVVTELLNLMVEKDYYGDFITNYRVYAQNLADGLDASLTYSSELQDIYTGSVYANIKNSDTNTTQLVLVGTQKVIYTASSANNGNGTIKYYYYPLSVTEQEFAVFAGLIS